MDASNIKSKISSTKQSLDSQVSAIEDNRRQLARRHAQQVQELQDATTRLCQIFARQDPSGFAGKILTSFRNVHADSRRLIAEDASRLQDLANTLIPQSQFVANELLERHMEAQSNLFKRQQSFDQALDDAQDQILRTNEDALRLSTSLQAGRERSERLSRILAEMKSQYQDLENRLQQDPVFAYFDSRSGSGSGFEQAVDRVLAKWCNYPEQRKVRDSAAEHVKMWVDYGQQLEDQMRQIDKQLEAILDGASKEPAVLALATHLAKAKSGFNAVSSELDDARQALNALQDERERLEDGSSAKTQAAIGHLVRQIGALTPEQLGKIVAGTTTKEDDALVDHIQRLGRPGATGEIADTERALQQVETELSTLRKRSEDLEKIEQGMHSNSLVSSRSRFRSSHDIEQAIERAASGQFSVSQALAVIAAMHYLKPLPPPPPVYRSSSSSSSSSSSIGGFGGGGGFSSGGGFGGGGHSTGGGF